MRGIAFFLIFMTHMFQNYKLKPELTFLIFKLDIQQIFFSNYGLHLFFVLSGYLLFKPFIVSIENNQKLPSIKKYMYRRITRIYPNYLFFLVLVIVISLLGWQTNPEYINYLKDIKVQFLSHAFMLHTFSSKTIYGFSGPWWSLGLEFQFYLFLGILMFIMKRKKHLNIKILFQSTLFILVLSQVFRILFVVFNKILSQTLNFSYINSESALIIFRNLPGLLNTFCCGMLLAIFLHSTKYNIKLSSNSIFPLCFISIIGLFITNYALTFAPIIHYYFGDILLSLFWSLILLCLLSKNVGSNGIKKIRSIISMKPLVFLGIISYSCYLSHEVVIDFLKFRFCNQVTNNLQFLYASLSMLVATIFVSFITYNLVEKPCLDFSAKNFRD
ncbi:acyltransferase family protein [Nostoc sp. 106C]